MTDQSYPKDVLKDIKAFFLEEQRTLQKRLEQINGADPYRDPYHTNSADLGEDANEEVQHEQAVAHTETLEKKKKDIAAALTRIEKGTYGFCKKCNQMIDTDRLSSNPYTLYCISCAQKE